MIEAAAADDTVLAVKLYPAELPIRHPVSMIKDKVMLTEPWLNWAPLAVQVKS